MDNSSFNICLDLIEWFESVCQTVPNCELSRNYFPIDGRIIHIPSPGILRVAALFVSSLVGNIAQTTLLFLCFTRSSTMDSDDDRI